MKLKSLPILVICGLMFFSCSQPKSDKAAEKEVKEEVVIDDSTAIYLWLSAAAKDRDAWHGDVNNAIDANGQVVAEGFYFNFIDSMLVYSLIKAASVEVAEELTSRLESQTSSTDITVRMLEGKKDIDLHSGHGDGYIIVGHPVKDLDKWYSMFSAMKEVKKQDSIYTLGVFADVDREEYVTVFIQATSLMKASRYGDNLEKSKMLEASGVNTEPDALVLREWSYKR